VLYPLSYEAAKQTVDDSSMPLGSSCWRRMSLLALAKDMKAEIERIIAGSKTDVA
jgi:hypothetical protein